MESHTDDDETGVNSLLEAARQGRCEEIQTLLLERHVDVNCREPHDRYTPLHVACSNGHKEAAQILLQHGATTTSVDRNGETPLHYAAEMGQETDLIQILVNHNGASSSTLHSKDHQGDTPLHAACLGGNAGVVQLLLDHGADSGGLNDDGSTPFFHACKEGNNSVVELLLSLSAVNVNHSNHEGETPLHHAESGPITIRLLEAGANVSATDRQGATPLHWKCVEHYDSWYEAAQQLIHVGHANVNAQDDQGRTPLHGAIIHGNLDGAKLLFGHGADLTLPDNLGKTPLYFAYEGFYSPIFAEWLESINATRPEKETKSTRS